MNPDLGQMIVEGIYSNLAQYAAQAWEWAIANPLLSLGAAALIIAGLIVPSRTRRRRRI